MSGAGSDHGPSWHASICPRKAAIPPGFACDLCGAALGSAPFEPPAGVACHGLPCQLARPYQAVRHHRGHRQGARAQSGGARRHWPRRRRAGLRHARQHQGRGGQGHSRRQDQVHGGRRHPRAEGGDRRQVQAREQPRLHAAGNQRRHRRQAGAVQRADGDAEPGRRGGDPGALLGELSGDRGARRGHAGAGRHHARRPVQADARGARRCDHAEDQVADPQLAVEPVRRRLYARRAEGAHRRADEASGRVGADRRYLRAPGLRRLPVRHGRGGRAGAEGRARSP